MKKVISAVCVTAISVLVIYSCQKNQSAPKASMQISQDVLDRIHQLGFSTDGVFADEEGNYIVEGDIALTPAYLKSVPDYKFLRIANTEQYRTTNLVKNLPRTIKISIASSFSAIYVAATDSAIARYNKLGLRITFQRVSSGANIAITKVNTSSYLASSGFPGATGNPYNSVKVSTTAIGNQPVKTIASILAHEIGHCIGFRHTDYKDRSYSCGGAHTNEGASDVGAILITGTPSGPDANSWMLSCISSGGNRPFNANDVIALNYLYK